MKDTTIVEIVVITIQVIIFLSSSFILIKNFYARSESKPNANGEKKQKELSQEGKLRIWIYRIVGILCFLEAVFPDSNFIHVVTLQNHHFSVWILSGWCRILAFLALAEVAFQNGSMLMLGACFAFRFAITAVQLVFVVLYPKEGDQQYRMPPLIAKLFILLLGLFTTCFCSNIVTLLQNYSTGRNQDPRGSRELLLQKQKDEDQKCFSCCSDEEAKRTETEVSSPLGLLLWSFSRCRFLFFILASLTYAGSISYFEGVLLNRLSSALYNLVELKDDEAQTTLLEYLLYATGASILFLLGKLCFPLCFGNPAVRKLQSRTFDNLAKQEPNFLDVSKNDEKSETLKQLHYNPLRAQQIQHFILSIPEIMLNVGQIIVCCVFIAKSSWEWLLLTLYIAPFFWILMKFKAYYIDQQTKKVDKLTNQFCDLNEKILFNLISIRTSNKTDDHIHELQENLRCLYYHQQKLSLVNTIHEFLEKFFTHFGTFFAFAAGRLLAKEFTNEEFIVVISFSLFLINSLKNLIRHFSTISEAFGKLQLFFIQEDEKSVATFQRKPKTKSAVLEQMDISWTSSELILEINEKEETLQCPSLVTLKGKSGCGKSRLLKSIIKFDDFKEVRLRNRNPYHRETFQAQSSNSESDSEDDNDKEEQNTADSATENDADKTNVGEQQTFEISQIPDKILWNHVKIVCSEDLIGTPLYHINYKFFRPPNSNPNDGCCIPILYPPDFKPYYRYNQNVDDNKLHAALEKAGIDTNEWDNKIKDKEPKHLSDGQKQRVKLAKLFYELEMEQDKRFIILLDEVTSALDQDLHYHVIRQIRKLAKNHLVINVAHRLDYVNKKKDRVLTVVAQQ